MENGLRLGPVGGRIVGEVFIGLVKADETSYLAAQPRWKPVLPSATRGDFRITDLLTFAGVVPPLDAVVARQPMRCPRSNSYGNQVGRESSFLCRQEKVPGHFASA